MEILTIADTVSRELGITADEVVEAMEVAIQKAARSKYGAEQDIRAKVNRKTGEVDLFRYREVMATQEEIENDSQQLTLEEAKSLEPEIEVGGFIIDDLPPIEYGRVATQTAKQVLKQKVRDAKRAHEFEEYKDRVGEIVNGTVKRVDYGNVTVDLGRGEGVIRRNEGIPRERLKMGDRVRAYILDVQREMRGPQIVLSRSHPDFMAALFKQEVPEIYDGVIEIKSVARDAGSRAKIAVYSHDPSIDPVGSCVGMRGSRVQAVVNELQGEKVDIVPWSDDLATLLVNALQPAELSRVVFDEENETIDVVASDEQLSLAIGRRGQNVRLASSLLGWRINIMSEAEEAEKRAAETERRTKLFMDALDVDDVLAHLLVVEGFVTVDDLALIDLGELAEIEGLDADIGEELQTRAQAHVEQRDREYEEKLEKLSISDELRQHPDLSIAMIVSLGENDVKDLDDLGDLATDELVEIIGEDAISSEKAEALIMSIREKWFAEEDAKAAAEEDAANAAA